ncbi:hypothetical protein FPZ42_00735 [Mucilaginibacter achroorhodeus]|uniref:Uncharacterized protein n=1 Tax=Mucilaginibacter achroorhodeus TaxID=2599294 RepID=A0A563U905_9SPHI|nr:hypothetical protein [Mucilaginibacter achroorhodeus]TWR27773.1 hypothetical protein FPZ42_00735 [Mucilaginibacter achroorhodeus]
MEKEYKLNLFAKIFYGAITGGFAAFLIILNIASPPNEAVVYVIIGIPVIICTLIFVNLFKSKVIVTETSITRQRIFYDRTLHFDDIKGVRIESKIIVIEPKHDTEKNFRVSNYSDLAGSDDLVSWLRESFPDLDKQDLEAETEILLDDASLGYTIEERKAKLSKTRGIAIAYSILGFIVPMILVFFSNPKLIFYVGLFFVLSGLIIIKFSNGLTKFVTNSKRSAYSGIAIGFMMPVIIMMVAAIKSFEILSFKESLKITPIFGLILFIPLFIIGRNKTTEAVKGQVLIMIIVSVLFGFSVTILANCLFDDSKPLKFTTHITEAYTTSGKGTHYHFKLNPWKRGRNEFSIDVSQNTYEKTLVGNSVAIFEKKGFLGIPWFDYEINTTPPAPADLNNENSPNPR